MTEDRTIPATARSGLRVALIGGGRWARVHAGVLQSLEGRVDRLIWVSRHNCAALTRDPTHGENVEILDDLQEALRRKPDAAVVCTASARHAGDAMLVVRQRIPVLVEKPLALDMEQATEVIKFAHQQGIVLCVCLPLLASIGLRRFKEVMHGRVVTSLRVRWLDPAVEMRYGETKNTDITTHKVDEFIPHLWSLIDVLVGPVESRLVSVAAAGDSVSVTIGAGQARVDAEFGRQAPARLRHVEVEFADGGTAEFEFAQEPGDLHVDGQRREFNNAMPSAPRPLASIHTQFLDLVQGKQAPSGNPFLASRCIGTVHLAQDVRSSVVAQEAKRTAALLGSGQRPGSSRELARLMLDNLGPELSHDGIRVAPDDLNAQARLVSTAESEVLQRAGLGGAQGGEGGREYRAHLARSEFIARVVRHLREMIAGRSG